MEKFGSDSLVAAISRIMITYQKCTGPVCLFREIQYRVHHNISVFQDSSAVLSLALLCPVRFLLQQETTREERFYQWSLFWERFHSSLFIQQQQQSVQFIHPLKGTKSLFVDSVARYNYDPSHPTHPAICPSKQGMAVGGSFGSQRIEFDVSEW